MKVYGGIDLHSNNNVIVLLDEEDRVVYRERLANDLQLVLRDLEPYRDEIEGLVVESTYNWYWLVDGLMDAGYRVHLANRAAIVQYSGLKYADDETAMPAGWPHYCVWVCCRRATSIRRRNVRSGICCASAASWSTSGPPTCNRCRI